MAVLLALAALPACSAAAGCGTLDEGHDYFNTAGQQKFPAASAAECCAQCQSLGAGCAFFTYQTAQKQCYTVRADGRS